MMTVEVNSKESASRIIRQSNEGHPKLTLTPSENSKRGEKRVGSFFTPSIRKVELLCLLESKVSCPPGQTSEPKG